MHGVRRRNERAKREPDSGGDNVGRVGSAGAFHTLSKGGTA